MSTCKPLAELGYKVVSRQPMYELNPGVIDSLTPAEIRQRYPEEWEKAQTESYSHRYPRGESYHDLSVRFVTFSSFCLCDRDLELSYDGNA